MKPKLSTLIVSLALIAAGVLFLAQNFGYIPRDVPTLWVAIFGGAGALFFIGYLASGLRQWGLLFPALISGALALTIGLGESGYDGSFMGTPVLAAVAIPFFAAFALNVRKNWWALIPGIILGVIALIPLLADRVPGELIGSMVLFSIALPFLIVFISDPSRRWALIPAGVIGAVALIPLSVALIRDDYVPVFVMILFAAPFALVYLLNRKHWWALIPSGVMASIGLAMLLVGGSNMTDQAGPLFSGIMFFGWAATFGLLWLLRGAHNTRWALIPAAALALVGVMSFMAAPALRFIWPVVLIVVGALVLFNGLRKPKAG
jgi:hypothetical protein